LAQGLKDAAAQSTEGYQTVSLSVGVGMLITPPPNLALLFYQNSSQIEEAMTSARNTATHIILTEIQGETPLLPYKRRILERLTPIFGGAGNCTLGFLPTRLDHVDLRYLYEEGNETPHLSLTFLPFTSNRLDITGYR